MTATTELVVPKSIPTTLPMPNRSPRVSCLTLVLSQSLGLLYLAQSYVLDYAAANKLVFAIYYCY